MQMFFYLIGFNGQCWQTYGPHAYYHGYIPTDILYYSKQINPFISSAKLIPDLIDKDPISFAVLFTSPQMPLCYHSKDLAVIASSKYKEPHFKSENYSDNFKIQQSGKVYKLSLKRWDTFPHFACCYYDKGNKSLTLSAMTVRGYEKLVETLNAKGHEYSMVAESCTTMNMNLTVEKLFGREFKPHPYERLFNEPEEKEQSDELKNINKFTGLFVDSLNAGKNFDLEKTAVLCGIDIKEAENIVDQMIAMFNKMSNGKKR